MEASIYSYTCISQFIKDKLEQEKKKDSKFSQRYFVRKAGLSSQSTLAMIVSGKRVPSRATLSRLGEALELSPTEIDFALTLAEFKKSKSDQEKAMIAKKLMALTPYHKRSVNLELEKFTLIADWYHVAILELVSMNDFCEEPYWIQEKLMREVSVPDIKKAIQRLLDLGQLERSESGRLVKTHKSLTAGDEGANEAIRVFHKQMLRKAERAIEGQEVDKRLFVGGTMNFSQENISQAREILDNCVRELHQLEKNKNNEQVYQISMQFFSLTKKTEEGNVSH